MNRSDGISIAHAPDRVEVGRVFRIVLGVPQGQTPVGVSAPGSVQVVDRTAPDRAGETIFYFRAREVARGARFRFDGQSAGAEAVVDCLDRAGILERREQGEVRLPRRWPVWEEIDEMKSSRTIWRQEDLARALAWGGRHPEEVRKVREAAEGWASKTDAALWGMLPKAEVPRWHFVNLHVGCPVHGDAIFKFSGYYPWKAEVEGVPYRVQCPVGGEWYPSNDVGADDFTSGDYPDDGYGCVKGDGKRAFVAVYQNVLGYQFNGGLRTLSRAYTQSGDEALLHKIRVMLLRMADEWAYLSGKIEDRFLYGGDQLHYVEKQPRWPMVVTKAADLNRSGMVNYCISLAGDFVTYATAYDLAWEGFDGDRDLLAMAGSRLGLRSGEEVRRYIEDHVFRVGAQTAIDGGAHSNLPHPQMGLTSLILAVNYRAGARLADWLWNGGGQMRYWIPNFFYRDGSAYESTGGYNGMHVDATPPIARGLARLKELRPEVYGGIGTFEADPKAKMLYTHLSDLICIGRMYPHVGDGGYQPRPGNPPLNRMYSMTQDAATHEYAFETYGDPVFARALWAGEGYEPGPESRVSREAVEAAVRQAGTEIALESGAFDGYGIAVLRSGAGDDARALWLRYGHARGHRQDDTLDIGLFAHCRNFMSQLGYPHTWATHGVWDANWLTHYRVKVRGIERGTIYRGALRSLGVTPGFQALRADGEAFRDRGNGRARYEVFRDQVYSRWVALVDVDDRDFYAVDLHRVRGGDEHWWSFHGPHGEAAVEGLRDVEAWPDGTPAGREVGYGEVEKLGTDDVSLHSLTYLYNCQRGEVAGPWGAAWRLSGDAGLELRMRQLAEDGEVIVGDGKPPISSKEDPPYRLTWTLAHRKGGAPLSSQFVTLIEAGEGGRKVAGNVERVKVQGRGAFEPVAVRAETARGTDLIVSAWEAGEVTPEAGDWSFDGECGFARTGAEGVEQVSVTGGRRFVVEGVGIAETTGTLTARVVGGDFRAREVILSGVAQPADAVVGQYVRFDSENRSSMYRVLAAKKAAQGTRLTLDVDIRIGEGTADGFEDGAIFSDVHFPLAGFRYYHGAYLRTVSGEVFVLDHIEPDTVANVESGLQPRSRVVLAPVDGRDVPADRLRTAFEAGKAFVIYDVGAGDRATFPLTAWVRRRDGQALRLAGARSGQAWEGFVGPGTVLAFGRGVSGVAQVSRGSREWTLPILQDGSGLSLVDLGEAGIGMGPVRITLKVR